MNLPSLFRSPTEELTLSHAQGFRLKIIVSYLYETDKRFGSGKYRVSMFRWVFQVLAILPRR